MTPPTFSFYKNHTVLIETLLNLDHEQVIIAKFETVRANSQTIQEQAYCE